MLQTQEEPLFKWSTNTALEATLISLLMGAPLSPLDAVVGREEVNRNALALTFNAARVIVTVAECEQSQRVANLQAPDHVDGYTIVRSHCGSQRRAARARAVLPIGHGGGYGSVIICLAFTVYSLGSEMWYGKKC